MKTQWRQRCDFKT